MDKNDPRGIPCDSLICGKNRKRTAMRDFGALRTGQTRKMRACQRIIRCDCGSESDFNHLVQKKGSIARRIARVSPSKVGRPIGKTDGP